MKTPLQQMIDKIRQRAALLDTDDKFGYYGSEILLSVAKMGEQMLADEKEAFCKFAISHVYDKRNVVALFNEVFEEQEQSLSGINAPEES